MNKIITILLILTVNLCAIQISQKSIKNANTLLIEINNQEISDAKLKFNEKTFTFLKNPYNTHNSFVLLPIPYYQSLKDYPLLISYSKLDNRVTKELKIEVIDGNYKAEIIKVSKSKVTPNKKNKKRTKKEYKEAMKIYTSKTKELLWDSEFIYPLNSKVTSAFGNKRVYNNTIKSFHGGTDFRAAIGTPIKAVNDGVIRLAKNRFYAGNSIIIDHGQGIYSCYYHLSKFKFKAGQKVKKGEVIALSGNTGRSTGPHLHFSMWVSGVLVDPMQLIATLNKLKK